MSRGRWTAIAATGVGLSLPYWPFVFGYQAGESAAAACLLGLAAVAAPAVAGMLWARGRGAARLFVHGLAAAALANVTVALLGKGLGIAPSSTSFAGALGLLTSLVGAVGVARGGSLPDPRRHALGWVLGLGVFAGTAWVGTSLVPPLEDQDTEVQGTAYGLAHDLEPLCLTNRSTLYFFAHPLLLHALNAATLTLAGDLEVVRPPYDAARAARPREAPEGTRLARALAAWRGEAERPDRSIAWYRSVYGPFLQTPALAGTRAPNFVLAAAVAWMLFAWAIRLGVSALDAALLVLAYVTLPEIAVRSSYGGYYALTAATFLAAGRLSSAEPGGGRAGYLAGVLAVLANQKALVIAAAAVVMHGIRAIHGRAPRRAASVAPLLSGVLLGGAAFWIYGLALAPEEFVADHLMAHGVERFSGGEVLSRSGHAVYASRVGVWWEFVRHFGAFWCGVAVVGLAMTVRALLRSADPQRRRELGLLLAWFAVGAILFTATDWRQTKHLCLLVPALTLMGTPVLSNRATWVRWSARLALLASLAWNVSWLVRMAHDFEMLQVTPVW